MNTPRERTVDMAAHALTRPLPWALAAVLLLAGCSLAPVHERPVAPVAADWPAAVASGTAAGMDGPAAAALPWEQFFADERQRALIRLALQNNRDLRIAALNVEQARALAGVQRADRLPGLAAGVTVDRGSTGSLYSVGVTVPNFELDLFGRVKNLSEAAQARYFASDEGRRAAQGALVAAVASADLALRADDELLALTRETLNSRDEQLRLVRVRLDAGATAEPELRGVESLAASARATLAALERQRAQDLNALVLLLGAAMPSDLPAARPLTDLGYRAVPAGVPSEVLLARPDVRQAEQTLVAASANIGVARAAFFPRISLTGSLGTASTELSDLFSNTAWSFTGQLLQPLFDAGRNQANLQATQAARDIAVAQYERTLQAAFREVADALAARATLGEQLAAQQAQAQAEAQRLSLAERLLAGGVASQLDRLDAERALLVARQAVVQLKLAERLNAVLMYRVLGGAAGPALLDDAQARTSAP